MGPELPWSNSHSGGLCAKVFPSEGPGRIWALGLQAPPREKAPGSALPSNLPSMHQAQDSSGTVWGQSWTRDKGRRRGQGQPPTPSPHSSTQPMPENTALRWGAPQSGKKAPPPHPRKCSFIHMPRHSPSETPKGVLSQDTLPSHPWIPPIGAGISSSPFSREADPSQLLG